MLPAFSRCPMKACKGTAVFMALLAVVMVTAIVFLWLWQERLLIKRVQQAQTSDQAILYAEGVVDWAITVLNKTASTPSAQAWPKILPKTVIESGKGVVFGRIDDYQSLLNVNDLDKEKNKQAFSNLLKLLNAGISEAEVTALTQAILHWIAPMSESNSEIFKGLDQKYLGSQPAYRAAHRPMQSISELRLVAGMNPVLLSLLQPYLSALPKNTEINFRETPALLKQAFQMGQVVVSSATGSYFLVRADVYLEGQHLILYALLSPFLPQNQFRVRWRSYNTV